MSVVIRCRACDKAVGWMDTPCLFSEIYIHCYGDMTVIDADIVQDDTGIWFCHPDCRKEGDVKRAEPLKLHMTGSWSDIKYKNKPKLPKKLEKGWI
jgi:hypothetical protein